MFDIFQHGTWTVFFFSLVFRFQFIYFYFWHFNIFCLWTFLKSLSWLIYSPCTCTAKTDRHIKLRKRSREYIKHDMYHTDKVTYTTDGRVHTLWLFHICHLWHLVHLMLDWMPVLKKIYNPFQVSYNIYL